VSSMVSYASGCRDDLEKIANSIRYANKLPPDFVTILLKDYMALESDYRAKLMGIPEFSSWLSKNARYFNDW